MRKLIAMAALITSISNRAYAVNINSEAGKEVYDYLYKTCLINSAEEGYRLSRSKSFCKCQATYCTENLSIEDIEEDNIEKMLELVEESWRKC
jgi:hypothetical protein